MTTTEVAILIPSLLGLSGALWKAFTAAVQREATRLQAVATIEAKNREIDALKTENTELKVENRRLWSLVGEAAP